MTRQKRQTAVVMTGYGRLPEKNRQRQYGGMVQSLRLASIMMHSPLSSPRRKQKPPMRRNILISIMLLMVQMTASAQTALDSVMSSVERKNATLVSLRKAAEAECAANHSGIALDNPEVAFGYLWGNPSSIGSRKDFSASQSLDLATLSGTRRKLAESRDVLAQWQYKTERQTVLLTARQFCIDIIYYNAMLSSIARRERVAASLVAACRRRMDVGDATQIDLNALRLSLSAVKAERRRTEGERAAVMAQLQQMNGGEPVALSDTIFPAVTIPQTFDAWYADAARVSPALAYARQSVEVSQRQLRLARQENLPQFKVGFQGEYVRGENYQGVTVGMTIPLWGSKSRIRQARAEAEASAARHADALAAFSATVRSLYLRQDALHQTAMIYAEALETTDNIPLLRRALDSGQISVSEYLTGTASRYEAESLYLDAMREWHRAWAELTAVGM